MGSLSRRPPAEGRWGDLLSCQIWKIRYGKQLIWTVCDCFFSTRSARFEGTETHIWKKREESYIIYVLPASQQRLSEGVSITSDITDETRGTRTSPFSPGGYDQAQGAPGR